MFKAGGLSELEAIYAIAMVADKHNYMILFFVGLMKKLFLNYRILDYERCSAKHPSIN